MPTKGKKCEVAVSWLPALGKRLLARLSYPEVAAALIDAACVEAAKADAARRRLARDQLAGLVNGLADLLDVLAKAVPEDKAEVYARLGLRLTYDRGAS